jgi:hypothetical protein
MRRAIALAALLALASAFGPNAGAQVLDAVEVVRDGNDAQIRIKFAVRIQYLRHVPLERGSLLRVYFQITGGEETAFGTVEEMRRSPPTPLAPRFEVVYPPQPPSAQRMIEVRFSQPVSFRVRPEDITTLLISVPIAADVLSKLPGARKPEAVPPPPVAEPPAAPSAPAPQPISPTPEALPEVEREAEAHMRSANEAVKQGATATALNELNRLLNLPPNRHSEEAQAKIGFLREELGDVAKARIEYELYLKLYPDGAHAPRIRERLAALAGAAGPSAAGAPAAPAGAPETVTDRAPPFTTWGSVSQFYYGGKSKIKTKTTIVDPSTDATTIDTADLAAVDQSQIITTVDANARWRSNGWDSRLVFRDAHTYSFLSDVSNENRLSALYGETRNIATNAMVRFGRQIGTSGGVLGRFDGVAGSWAARANLRFNAVAGRPVDVPDGVHPTFAGASADFDNVLRGTNATLYAIGQRVSGATDRFGLGTEIRYFDAQRTAYGIFDYDPLFRAVNVASAQATFLFTTGTTLNLLADYRRTPTLQLTNVTVPEQTSDMRALIALYGVAALRAEAKAFTPISKVFLVGVTHPINGRWQLGFDFRVSSLTGTPETSLVPATPGTDGNVYTYTAQAIANGLTRYSDILVLNGSILRGTLLDAWLVGVDYRFVPAALLTLEPSFKFYHQRDNQGTDLDRWSPGVRAIYQLRERFSFEGEYNAEKTHTRGNLVDDDSLHHFFYLGWRWIF